MIGTTTSLTRDAFELHYLPSNLARYPVQPNMQSNYFATVTDWIKRFSLHRSHREDWLEQRYRNPARILCTYPTFDVINGLIPQMLMAKLGRGGIIASLSRPTRSRYVRTFSIRCVLCL
jgi:hypothetical protein